MYGFEFEFLLGLGITFYYIWIWNAYMSIRNTCDGQWWR